MAPSLFKFTFTFFKELLDCMKVNIKVRKDHFIYNRERERDSPSVWPASSSFKYLLRNRGFIIAPECYCQRPSSSVSLSAPLLLVISQYHTYHITDHQPYYCHSSYVRYGAKFVWYWESGVCFGLSCWCCCRAVTSQGQRCTTGLCAKQRLDSLGGREGGWDKTEGGRNIPSSACIRLPPALSVRVSLVFPFIIIWKDRQTEPASDTVIV